MNYRFKASKTLLGIETKAIEFGRSPAQGFKASKTLLGIETKYHAQIANIFLVIQSL